MSEEEQKLRAFLADVITLCRKHNMAILNLDEDGMGLVTWDGWRSDFHNNDGPPKRYTPRLVMYDITPEPREGEGDPLFVVDP